MKRKSELIVIWLLCSISVAMGMEVYVQSTGNSLGNCGQTKESPCKNIQSALATLPTTGQHTIRIIELGSLKWEGNCDLLLKETTMELTIQGLGADQSVIDCEYRGRFASIENFSILTLRDISFRNYQVDGNSYNQAFGGALFVDQSSLEIHSCVFQNGVALGSYSSAQSGAIYVTDSLLFVTDSLFSNHSAGIGGTMSFWCVFFFIFFMPFFIYLFLYLFLSFFLSLSLQ